MRLMARITRQHSEWLLQTMHPSDLEGFPALKKKDGKDVNSVVLRVKLFVGYVVSYHCI